MILMHKAAQQQVRDGTARARQRSVDTFTRSAQAGAEASTAETVWLRSPAPRRWWRHEKQVRTLTLSLIALKTGVETARVTATLTAMPGHPGAGEEAATIATLAAAALQTPAASTASSPAL